MRVIGVVTVGRSDYGIYTPILKKFQSFSDIHLRIYLSGMHLSDRFGSTYQMVEKDGYTDIVKIPTLVERDHPSAVAQTIANGLNGFSKEFENKKPDLLLVLGDRFDMYCAALAALPFQIPVAHIHGGELTFGAIDDALRHSFTKLSHLHFAATDVYAKRIIQMGEEPWRVYVSGAPSLDALKEMQLLSPTQLSELFEQPLPQPFLLATLHPETMNFEGIHQLVREFFDALERSNLPVVFTMSNADPGGQFINQQIEEYVKTHSNAYFKPNLGSEIYFSMMKHASAMVGNSSSGIIEAATFQLPVVNIGERQSGRIRAKNVIDCPVDSHAILNAIHLAISEKFRNSLKDLVNPYGKGNASDIIVSTLRSIPIDSKLLTKKFYDLNGSEKCQ